MLAFHALNIARNQSTESTTTELRVYIQKLRSYQQTNISKTTFKNFRLLNFFSELKTYFHEKTKQNYQKIYFSHKIVFYL